MLPGQVDAVQGLDALTGLGQIGLPIVIPFLAYCAHTSVADPDPNPDPDPVGSGFFGRIRIRIRVCRPGSGSAHINYFSDFFTIETGLKWMC